MLVNATKLLIKAQLGNYAICQFNINNLEWTRFILEECQSNKSPVMLGVSSSAANYMGGLNTVANLVKSLIKDLNISIPVVLHLDHGTTYEICKEAIDAGFTSVMIDASKYSLNKNIEITKKVVDYANKFNVSVEAEIGQIGGEEDGIKGDVLLADINDCVNLVNETKINFLAPAVGSAHGLYKGKPNLDFNRITKIKNETKIPLVLHGASGISDEDIKKAIQCGIAKININTDIQVAWAKQVRLFLKNDLDVFDPRKIIKSGEEAFKEIVKNKLVLTNSINKK